MTWGHPSDFIRRKSHFQQWKNQAKQAQFSPADYHKLLLPDTIHQCQASLFVQTCSATEVLLNESQTRKQGGTDRNRCWKKSSPTLWSCGPPCKDSIYLQVWLEERHLLSRTLELNMSMKWKSSIILEDIFQPVILATFKGLSIFLPQSLDLQTVLKPRLQESLALAAL